MLDLKQISKGLDEGKGGIWTAKKQSDFSYPETGNELALQVELTSFWFRHRSRCIVEALRAYPPNQPVFDIGGGNGVMCLALNEAGIRTVLVEPGPIGVKNAQARGLAPIVQATLEDARFHGDSLPSAGLFDVLEHIELDEEFLHTIYELLAPDGRVYLTVPAYQRLWSHEDDFAGHYRRYSIRSLGEKMKKAGFHIEYGTYFFALLPLPILLFRTIPTRLKWRRLMDESHNRGAHELSGTANKLLWWLLDLEFGLLKKGIRLPFGGSCLMVGRKETPTANK